MSLFFSSPFQESDHSILNNSVLDDFENDVFGHPYGYYPLNFHFNPQKPQKQNKKPNANPARKSSSHLFNHPFFDKDVYKLVDFSPKVNIGEDDTNYYIEVDLPGMSKEQIQMELSEEKVLTISGERTNKNSGMKSTKMDCQYGKFSRSFSIADNANLEKIEAKMENGVLTVTIPKVEPQKKQSRTIQIQ